MGNRRERCGAALALCVVLGACRIDYEPLPLDGQLLFSASADRSAPSSLEGATLSGERYVFAVVDEPDAVEFYWQSRTLERLQRQNTVPWDLGGGPVDGGPAHPVDFDGFPAGPQRLVALGLVDDSIIGSLAAEFTVAPSAPRQLAYRSAAGEPWAPLDGALVATPTASIFLVSPPPYPADFALDAPTGRTMSEQVPPYFFHPRGRTSGPEGELWSTSLLEPGMHTLEVSWPDAPDEPPLSATFEIPP